MKTYNYRIFGLFTFIIFSWGLAWPINKIGLAYMSPTWYTAIRLVTGTLTMMALVIVLKKFTLPKRKDLPLILIIGFLQISLYIWLTNIGLAYLPAGRSLPQQRINARLTTAEGDKRNHRITDAADF